jgi:hypothetical protein
MQNNLGDNNYFNDIGRYFEPPHHYDIGGSSQLLDIKLFTVEFIVATSINIAYRHGNRRGKQANRVQSHKKMFFWVRFLSFELGN